MNSEMHEWFRLEAGKEKTIQAAQSTEPTMMASGNHYVTKLATTCFPPTETMRPKLSAEEKRHIAAVFLP